MQTKTEITFNFECLSTNKFTITCTEVITVKDEPVGLKWLTTILSFKPIFEFIKKGIEEFGLN